MGGWRKCHACRSSDHLFLAPQNLKDKWKEILGINLKRDVKYLYVCENHFSDDSFKNWTIRKELKSGALPVAQKKTTHTTNNVFNVNSSNSGNSSASESVSQMFYRNDIIMKDSSPQMNINDQIYNQSADVNADIDKLDVSQKDKVSLPHLSNDNQDINYNSNTEMEDKENKELAHKYSKPNIDQLKSKCEQDHCYNIPYQDKTNFETPGKAILKTEKNKEKELKMIYKKYFISKNKNDMQCKIIKEQQREIRYLKSEKHNKKICKNVLRKRGFSEPETKWLISGKNPRNLQSQDMVNGLVIKSMSPRTYRYIKRKKCMYVPGPTTLLKAKKKMNIRYGFQEHLLRGIKIDAEKDREVWLSGDHMAVRQRYSYDKLTKQVIGPNSEVLVVYARGMMSSWKTPIFVDGDQKITLELIKKLIIKVEELGFKVRGFSFDLGNSQFLSEVNFYSGSYFFEHPLDSSRKVYLNPDPPHNLKNFRNHVYAKGLYFPTINTFSEDEPEEFDIENSSCLSRQDFVNILHADNGEFKLNCKFTKTHAYLPVGSRTCVRTAAQTFSTTNANVLLYMDPNNQLKSEVVQTINDYFDVLNVGRIYDSTPCKCAFGGQHKDIQVAALRKMKALMTNCKWLQRNSLLPCQLGIIANCNAMLDLLTEIQSEGFKYLLTRKLNQDCCENCFSQNRCLCPNNNRPDALEMLQYLTITCIIRTEASLLVPDSANVECDKGEEEEGRGVRLVTDAAVVDNRLKIKTGITSESEVILDINEAIEREEDSLRDDASNNVIQKGFEEEGFQYVVGYITFKLYQKIDYPMGEKMEPGQKKELGWLGYLNKQGLMKPTPEFTALLKKFEILFKDFHGEGLCVIHDPIDKFFQVLKSKFKETPTEILFFYSKVRFFIRLKHLNKQLDLDMLESIKKQKVHTNKYM